MHLKNQHGNTTKQTDELSRQKVGKHRRYIDANKLANVRKDIMEKDRLKAAEIEKIKTKIKQPVITE